MTQQQLSSTHTVFGIDNGYSTEENPARSLVNTQVIFSVICTMTFLIMLLYKFRFVKRLNYTILHSPLLFPRTIYIHSHHTEIPCTL
mmetsp:Transcript_18070/g.26508  ORF Transcript_18070/g.26508 Transcript_18070/m.26508 type:complete len:87 (+) Transcript_18070:34-294(+)